MVYDAARDRIVLFGGTDRITTFGDTWTFNGVNWTLAATTGPAPRRAHSMAYDPSSRRVLLFGGLNAGGGPLGDTWEWDGAAWIQRTPAQSPSARPLAAMVFDEVHGHMVLFGGGYLALPRPTDTWTYSGGQWTLVPTATAPNGRFGHTMSFDCRARRVLLYGGSPDGFLSVFGDLWTWDGTDWTLLSPPGVAPPARYTHAGVFDCSTSRLVIAAGSAQNGIFLSPANQTWEFDGYIWHFIEPGTGLGHRSSISSAYDTVRRRMVVFGGETGDTVIRDETWSYEFPTPPQVILEPLSQRIDAAENAVLSTAAVHALPLSYQWRRNGVPVVDGGRLSGAQTPTLTFTPVWKSDEGAYDCVITARCARVITEPAGLIVCCRGDANCNGVVNFNDITTILTPGFWLSTCP